jgi:hypothetical protein
MLAETMAEVKAGRIDPEVANTVAYLATVLLRAYEADAAGSAETPAQPFVPLIYRSLRFRDGRKHEADDVIDLETGERVALPAADVPFEQIGSSRRTKVQGFRINFLSEMTVQDTFSPETSLAHIRQEKL